MVVSQVIGALAPGVMVQCGPRFTLVWECGGGQWGQWRGG